MGNLRIDYVTGYELEMIMREHPELEDDIQKKHALANQRVNDIKLELEIVIGTVVSEICSDPNRKIPPSAKQEVRRTEVPLDPRYQKVVRRLNKAIADAETLQGTCYSMANRGKILVSLGNTLGRMLTGGPITYKDNRRPEDKVDGIVEKLDDS